ncbi:MAG: hypothetical protein ACK5QT_10740 [Oligoflexia bacterium]|jgi:hypothetical protein
MNSFKKSIYGALFALSAAAISTPPALAAGKECACDSKCMESCAKGDTKSCSCKTCDCSKDKGCSHDKCNHKR